MAQPLYPPAPVDLFHVCEKGCIEPTGLVKHVRPHKEARPCSPKYLPIVIVLTPIGFEGGKHAAPTKNIAQPVNEAPRSARVLKHLPLLIRQNLGLTGYSVWISVHNRQNRGQPTGCHLNVGIDKGVIRKIAVGSANTVEGGIVTSGITGINGQFNNPYGGKMGTYKGHRIVDRGTIGHVYRVSVGVGEQDRQEFR